jgi:nucleotide-binding universal stress UspA family protein
VDVVDQAGAEGVQTEEGREARPRVVVGIDGSSGSREALVHALIAAARRGADLDVVSTYSIQLYYVGGAPLDVPNVAAIRDDRRERAQAVIDEVRAEIPVSGVPGIQDVGITLFVEEGPAARSLLERSEGAALLEVGSRGRGAVRSAVLGSVALHCVTHAACPVVVVHPAPVVRQPPLVVVGIDGSENARAALAAAIDEAVRMGAEVEAVASYVPADYWTELDTIVVPSHEQIVESLQQQTRAMVDEVLAERSAPGDSAVPAVRAEVFQGTAADVLVHRAASADLLVVGSRGRGTFRGLLLGSVALHCAMHAPCPVMVVHPSRSRSTAGAGAVPTARGIPTARAMSDVRTERTPGSTVSAESPARRRPRLVVGVDGSPGSRAALGHAMTIAARRGADVEVVSTYPVLLSWTGGAPVDAAAADPVREDTESRIREVLAEVRADPAVAVVPGAGEVPVSLVVTVGPAAQELVDRSRDADLLVVGSRGRGAVRSALLGSVALHCATHARCPVLVVHPADLGRPQRSRIVVGIDGSDRSRAALVAAVDEAGRRGAEVVAVAAYDFGDWRDLPTVVLPSAEELRAGVLRGAEEMVREVLAGSGRPGVPSPHVRTEVMRGAAADLLVEVAEEADLLVVGNRGRGALRGLLLGSVALHCVLHAACPVMVVHPQSGGPASEPVRSEPALAGGG